jgi:hypothetical protein
MDNIQLIARGFDAGHAHSLGARLRNLLDQFSTDPAVELSIDERVIIAKASVIATRIWFTNTVTNVNDNIKNIDNG